MGIGQRRTREDDNDNLKCAREGRPALLMSLLDAKQGPCVVMLHELTDDGIPLVVMPSTWGTVSHYVRLALDLPTTVWGIEHGYVRTGDAAYMRPDTIEVQALEHAVTIGRACTHTGRVQRFHVLGGSVGALLCAFPLSPDHSLAKPSGHLTRYLISSRWRVTAGHKRLRWPLKVSGPSRASSC